MAEKEYYKECPVCRRRVRANPSTGKFLAHSRRRGARKKNCPGGSTPASDSKSAASEINGFKGQVNASFYTRPPGPRRTGLQLKTISCAEVAQERTRIAARLAALPVANSVLHQNAMIELNRRLSTWWGEIPLAPPNRGRPNLSRIAWGATRLPIVIPINPIEQLILRAIAPAEPTLYGVTPEGAIYAIDVERNHRIFMGYVSPLLEEVANLFLIVTGGKHGRFIEDDGGFFADYSDTGDYRPFVVVGSERVSVIADRCLDALGRPLYGKDVFHGLLVDFRYGTWPSSGVLSKMGYHVGMTGLPAEERREILRKVVNVSLVGTTPRSQAYVRDWGGPRSEMRISKIASSLGAFASLARGRRDNTTPAVTDWEQDLRWLRRTFGR